MSRATILFMAALALLLGGVGQQTALGSPDGIPYNYQSYGNTLEGPLGQTFGPCSNMTFVSGTLSVSNCSPAPGVLMSADSLATYTALHADSSLTLDNALLNNAPDGIFASGYARTVDNLDLGSPNSSVAFLGFTFHVDGTLTNSGLTEAFMTLNFGFAYDSGFAGQPIDGSRRGISSGSRTVNFTWSSQLYPISLFKQNTYWFSMSAQEYRATSASPVSGSASSSFFNTATITSVQPYDANMNFIPDATISSIGNNGIPFVNAPAVPEPATLLLLGTGLGVIGLTAWRRKK